jgi:multiple sugar transport system substrate-binding protein
MPIRQRHLSVAAALVAGGLFLGACGTSPAGENQDPDGGASPADPEADVTIEVGGLPSTENAESRQLWLDRIAEFEELHPNITVEGVETTWDPTTFNALLQGGTLPNVLGIAFTDIQGLIARDQVADITDYVEGDEVIGALNENVVDLARDAEGRLYGVPTNAYTMGLLYNRDLFEQAGLDPDSPPTTWDEVAEAAQTIKQATGVGSGLMSMENAGGWTLSALSYAFGGLMEDDVEGTTQAVFAETGATQQALEWVSDVRWSRGGWIDETLLGGDDARNQFAAGNLAIWVGGADIYNDVVGNRGMDPEDVGIAPMPQDSDALGALGGGTIDIVAPDSEPNQIAASIEWIKFNSLLRYFDEDYAVSLAESTASDGMPVGAPLLPVVSQQQYDTYLGWISDHVNVDQENYTAYLESTQALPVVPEPAVEAQALYAALDPVLQTVLTEEGADIPALLQTAQDQFNTQISAG